MLKLAVIGDPISHSLSPIVHMSALNALNIECDYQKIKVSPIELKYFLNFAESNLDGFNLTMPHKKNILPYLYQKDDYASLCGAVNTVCVNNGNLYGYNTDGIGLKLAVNNMGVNFKDKTVTVFGAGGAANSVISTIIAEKPKELKIACRTKEKAFLILDNIKDIISAKTEVFCFSLSDQKKACENSHILINTTPLGMEGVDKDFNDFSFIEALNNDALICDLIYKPCKTNLLKQGKAQGHPIQNGLDMLIFQALAADEKYLGIDIDMPKLYNIVKSKLK